jgi:hypothetical protein
MTELKTFTELARMIEGEQRAEVERTRLERVERKQDRQDQSVVGGVYRPDPVDRAAAMLLARAPWWAFAPSVRQEPKQEGRQMSRINEACTYGQGELGKDRRQMLGDVDCTEAIVKRGKEEMYNMDKLAGCFLRHIEEKYPPKVTELARSIADARAVIDENLKGIGDNMQQFERVMKDATQSVRASRMTIVSECSSVVNALKDVRQFFLGPDYEREQKRLVEFVDLCERLKRLKDSGFLDTVADTMIRLAAYEK